MTYKEFNNAAVIAAKKEKTPYQVEKRQLKKEVLNMTIKGLMFLCALYVICCLVFGLAADASTYNYAEWYNQAENIALEHILNNDLYYEVWEAADFLKPGYQEILANRQNKIEIVEHTTIKVKNQLPDGRFYGYDEIGQFIIVQKDIKGLKVGDLVECWFCYDNTNYTDGIESVYYIKSIY